MRHNQAQPAGVTIPGQSKSAELSVRALTDGGRAEKICTTVYRSRSAIWMVFIYAGGRTLPAFYLGGAYD